GHSHIEGFNEHVWFDVHTVSHVAEQIAADLAELDPAGKADYSAAAETLAGELEAIEGELDELHAKLEGTPVFITEPLPGALAAAAGLDDVAPEGFASAVEEGNEVAPAILLESLSLVEDGGVRAVLAYAQTGGTETSRIENSARDAGIPVITFHELLSADQSYAEWMRSAISDLAAALDG
ncbi:MAG: zinc ABC transporter substrate-binding protein, partial [Actinomycetota bacterium]|nr:zinc ABC transporter substrate-binding protein [Actinomycetota bacterium]